MYESFVRDCKALGFSLEETIHMAMHNKVATKAYFKKPPPSYVIILWWKVV